MRSRLRLAIRGAVQGVGFRPFVYRLATGRALDGWVRNSVQGVFVEVEGEEALVRAFLDELRRNPPPRAAIQSLEATWLDPASHQGFEIRSSSDDGDATAVVLPDIATCEECRREIFDPANRRYRYPFSNCTNCGPRFSIISGLPYDRANTSMRTFAMCPDCALEYHDPSDRRFHAQPNACPACGPALALWARDGQVLAAGDGALRRAVDALGSGAIVAVKGLGGFHLIVDATDEAAVRQLRDRKHRVEKPFALMYPSRDLVARDCEMTPAEAELIGSPEAPIVLLARGVPAVPEVAASVSPGSPTLGVMLPYTPLHHLLMADFGRPVVATSGNVAEEPICTDEHDALERLGGIADLFLVHNRPIVRHVDDSIVRVVLGRELVLRRARGYAPLPLPLGATAAPALAVGAHLKNTVAVTTGADAVVSQHIGDLETPQSTDAFRRVASDLLTLFRVEPRAVVTDDHPDYLSTRYAAEFGLPLVSVQHHLAHVAACMAENDLDTPALGVSWDGTGYGADGTVWGGEFLLVEGHAWGRVACLRPFQLPGGERAVREPRRSALGVLAAIGWPEEAMSGLGVLEAFTSAECDVLVRALARGVNAPVTTSAGRLFDAVAALAGLGLRSSFEGQAAMALEWAFNPEADGSYPFGLSEEGDRRSAAMGRWRAPCLVVDWEPAIRAVVDDVSRGEAAGTISARFHRMLAEVIVAVAERIGERRVVLTGGCFQNRRLTELAVGALGQAGFRPYWHQRVPPNDGGIAVGQLAAWARGLAGPPAAAGCEEARPADVPKTVST